MIYLLLRKTIKVPNNPVMSIFILLFLTFSLFFFLTCAEKYDDMEEFNTITETRGDDTTGGYDDSEPDRSDIDFLYREGEDTDKEIESNKQEKPEQRMKVYFGFLRLFEN